MLQRSGRLGNYLRNHSVFFYRISVVPSTLHLCYIQEGKGFPAKVLCFAYVVSRIIENQKNRASVQSLTYGAFSSTFFVSISALDSLVYRTASLENTCHFKSLFLSSAGFQMFHPAWTPKALLLYQGRTFLTHVFLVSCKRRAYIIPRRSCLSFAVL